MNNHQYSRNNTVKDEGVICNITVKKKNSIAPKGALPLSTKPYSKTSFASTKQLAQNTQRVTAAKPRQNLLNAGFGGRNKSKGMTQRTNHSSNMRPKKTRKNSSNPMTDHMMFDQGLMSQTSHIDSRTSLKMAGPDFNSLG